MSTVTRTYRLVDARVEFRDELDPSKEYDPLDWSRGIFKPERIRLVYQHMRGDEKKWRAYAIVYGTRIRQNGTLGAHDASQMFAEDHESTPQWVRDYIVANTPPIDGIVALVEWADKREPPQSAA
jgi:hypothetical protein